MHVRVLNHIWTGCGLRRSSHKIWICSCVFHICICEIIDVKTTVWNCLCSWACFCVWWLEKRVVPAMHYQLIRKFEEIFWLRCLIHNAWTKIFWCINSISWLVLVHKSVKLAHVSSWIQKTHVNFTFCSRVRGRRKAVISNMTYVGGLSLPLEL